MCSTKSQVDRHVKEIFNKLNTDSERDAKCYMLAKLYYKVKDYDSAIKYVNRYIVNHRITAQVQRFLGECYEASKQPSKALDAYKASLELDGGQRDLVLKVCELLSDPELPLVSAVASYWLDRLSGLFPKHPIVFKLRERLLRAHPEAMKDPRELESLILSEIMARPNAPEVRIRFLDFLVNTNKVDMAMKQAAELIPMDMFPDHLPWFDCLNRVNLAYEKEANAEFTRDFWLMKLTVLERRSNLSLQDHDPNKRTNADCAMFVFEFDVGLDTVSKYKPKPWEKLLFESALAHFRAQLAYQMAVLKLRRAKSEPGTWERAFKVASPLLAIATKRTDVADGQETKVMALWRTHAALRVSVSAHVLHAWADGNARFLEEVYKTCGGKWRERLYENIFPYKEHLDGAVGSNFLNNSWFLDLPTAIPSSVELEHIDRDAQRAHPNSLHHMVWLGLANSVSLEHIRPNFRCHLFPNMPLTVTNMENSSPDTLNRLDVDTFLYAAVFCAKKEDELRPNSERPKLLPVCIAERFCSSHQTEWWSLVNMLSSTSSSTMNNDQRLRLRKGIETIRVLGAHGLHPKLLYHIARQFRLIHDSCEDINMQKALDDRSEILWRATLPLLERLKQRQLTTLLVRSKLFDYGVPDWPLREIEDALEEGKTCLASLLLSAENYEEALDMLWELTNPEALYYQALIYKILAENSLKSVLNSESRADAERMLRKARVLLEDAEIGMRKGGVFRLNNLKDLSGKAADEIDALLTKVDSSSSENGTYFTRKANNKPLESVLRQTLQTSTPKLVRSPTTVENVNTSLSFNHDVRSGGSNNDSVTDQLKLLRSEMKSLLRDEMGDITSLLRGEMGDIKNLLQEIVTEFKKIAYKLVERQEMEDILNAEDFANEEGYDEDTETYYNIPQPNATRAAPPAAQPVVPQFPYGTLQQYMPGMLWSGGLPFSEGQQLPDFRSLQSGPPVPGSIGPIMSIPAAGLPVAPPADQTSKIVPNVVVTTSVTLPTYSRTPQPPMAVTIPPEHVRGGHRTQDPNSHAFQISVAQNLTAPVTVESPSDKYQARAYEQSPQSFQSTIQKTSDNPVSGQNNKSGAFSTPQQTNPILTNQRRLSEPRKPIFEAAAELSLNHQKPVPDWIPGTLSIIRDLAHNTGRVIMRHVDGQTIIDVQLSPTMTLSRCQSDNTFSWSVPDYGYGDSAVQKFVVRFKEQAACKDFEQAFKQFGQVAPVEKPAPTPPKPVVAAPVFGFASPKTSVSLSSAPVENKIDALASTEKTVFGTKVPSGFNFTSLAQTGQVSNAFAPSTEFKGFAGMGMPLFAANTSKNKLNDSVDQDASGEEDKEYEPNVEFAPVIPLPDLVEVKTGEEDEEKVYEERAKILKYTSETKEWKEKGRGNVKILQHPETGKVRIVMRRDQVHKVCCNHFLDETMKFERMKSSQRAATWTAQDFSAGELSPELLAIQFSKPEILDEFLQKIENLQQKMRDGCIAKKSTDKKLKSGPEPALKPLSEMFKKTPGSWECDLCLVLNKPDVYKCVACETKRPGDFGPVAASTTAPPKCAFSFGIPPVTSESSTPVQKTVSFGFPSSTTTSSPFSFGTPAGVSFGSTPPAQPFSFGVTPVTNSSPFKIGSSDTFNFKFNKSLNDTKQSEADDEEKSEDESHDVEHEDENLTFKPVIPLPEKVPLHTGEEDEDVVYSHRAKLFRYNNKEWKERGLGDLKILKHKETKKVRLLMRREQVFKICLNHYLLKDMEFSAKDGKSWIWTATDFSEGSVSNELFCIRFRDEEIAGNFKKAIDTEQANLVASPQTAKATTNVEHTPSESSAVRTLFQEGEAEVVYEYVASAEDQAEAKRLQLPPNFRRYKESKPCPGCIGCDNDESSDDNKQKVKHEAKKTPSPKAAKTATPKSAITPANTEENCQLPKAEIVVGKAAAEQTPVKTFGQLPKPETIFSKAAAEQTPTKVETEDKAKSSVFANFSFKSAFDAPGAAAAPTSFFGSASGGIFGGKTSSEFSKAPIFGGSTLNTGIFGGASSLDDPDKPVFNADSNLSFANLSKSQTAFGSSSAPTWDTTVKPIFTKPQQKRNEVKSDEESESEGSDEDADDAYDPHYKPIIDLPDAIELKTGEEDEVKLFCERAKLYRFDAAAKEWKERGIGDIKILHNPEHGSYRILMRREHVHKTVCNMRISSQLELHPMNKSANAWIWYGSNYLDEGAEDEQLAVKFKTEQSSGLFKSVIDSALEELANASRELTGDEYYAGEGEDDGDDDASCCEEMTLIKNGVTMSVCHEADGTREEKTCGVVLRIYESRSKEVELCFGDGENCYTIHSNPTQDLYSKFSERCLLLTCIGETECKYLIEFSTDDDAEETYDHLLSIQAIAHQE